MKSLKSLFNVKTLMFILLAFSIITAAVSFGYKSSQTVSQPELAKGVPETPVPAVAGDDLSKVVLSVRNMSCSGCIANIKSAVSDIGGIRDTLVDIGSGTVEIYYDNKRIQDLLPIAEAITASGYPASVRRIVSPDEIRKESALAAAKAQYYIASVGGYEISRTDFDTELEIAKGNYSKTYGENLFKSVQGQALLDNLKGQIASRLINEGVFMQEISRTGFKVDREILENELNAFLKDHGKNFEEIETSLKEVGYDPNYLRKKFETKVLINRYVNDRVLPAGSNDFEKQSVFNSWYSNAKTLAEVIYYDKGLERLMQNLAASSSCGGSR